MNIKSVCFVLLLFYNVSVGNEIPAPGYTSVTTNINWYKWDTKNFTILSLNNQQGQDIAEHIESLKTWTVTRWGLPDIIFSQKCKILCVPNKDYLYKLFKLKGPYAEIKFNNLLIEASSCWVVSDDTLIHSLSVFVTDISLTEIEQRCGKKFCYWAHKGISLLNGDLNRLRVFVAPFFRYLEGKNKIYSADMLFTATKEMSSNSSQSNNLLFDWEATLLCLMLRKEFGQRRFLILITDSSTPRLKLSTGYVDCDMFNVALKRYFYYASRDISTGQMPDNYLVVEPVK